MHAPMAKPPQLAREERTPVARPRPVCERADEPEGGIRPGLRKILRRLAPDLLRIDRKECASRAAPRKAATVNGQIDAHDRHAVRHKELQQGLVEVLLVSGYAGTGVDAAHHAVHALNGKVVEEFLPERMPYDAEIPFLSAFAQIAHDAVVAIHALAIGERERGHDKRRLPGRTAFFRRLHRGQRSARHLLLEPDVP